MDMIHHNEYRDNIKSLGKILGVYWTREQVESFFGKRKRNKQTEPIQEVMIPFVLWQSPEIGDYLRKLFGSSKKSEAIECFDLPRDEFLRIASMFAGIAESAKRGL